MNPKAVVLLSGGLDSSTVAAVALSDGYEVIALSLRYGQRHQRELLSAQIIVQKLEITEHFVVDVNLALWGGSALTDKAFAVPTDGIKSSPQCCPEVTSGQAATREIPVTYVPGRNTVFIALALSLAEAKGAEAIYLGINAIDYSGYPDCRPEYLAAYQQLANLSSKVGIEGKAPRLVAPLVMDSKADIVRRAVQLGVPIELTWSCYQGEEEPCGRCDSCRIRDCALIEAGYPELATIVGQTL